MSVIRARHWRELEDFRTSVRNGWFSGKFNRAEKLEPLDSYLGGKPDGKPKPAPAMTPEQESLRWRLWAVMINAGVKAKAKKKAEAEARAKEREGEASNRG